MPDYLPTLADAPLPVGIPGAEERLRRARIAELLLKEGGSGEPIQSWTQGLNRVAQGLVGGYQLGQVSREAQAERDRRAAALGSIFDQYRDQGAGTPPAAIPQRAAKSDSPAAVPAAPAAPPAMDPRARGIAALSDPGVMAGRPDQNRFLDISTAVPTAYTLPPDRAKVASTARVVGDDEGVRLGLYDAPTTPGARPPNQPDVAALPGMTPTGATPVQTQSIRPPAQPASAPGARGMDQRVLATLRGLAASGDPALEKYALERLADYTKPTQFQVVTVKRPGGGEESVLFNPATNQFAQIPSTGPKPSGAIQAEVDRLVAAGADEKTARIEATKRAQGENFPTDVAGKLAALETSQAEMKNYRGVLTGEWGGKQFKEYYAAKAGIGAAAGEIGTALRAVRSGIESVLRIMTGAAAPEPEVARYADMYQPTPFDNALSRAQKARMLDGFMRRASALIRQGRTMSLDEVKKEMDAANMESMAVAAPERAQEGGGDPLAQARDAIGRGADRAKVIERLRQQGINPQGL